MSVQEYLVATVGCVPYFADEIEPKVTLKQRELS
jgi:hypothetical protein